MHRLDLQWLLVSIAVYKFLIANSILGLWISHGRELCPPVHVCEISSAWPWCDIEHDWNRAPVFLSLPLRGSTPCANLHQTIPPLFLPGSTIGHCVFFPLPIGTRIPFLDSWPVENQVKLHIFQDLGLLLKFILDRPLLETLSNYCSHLVYFLQKKLSSTVIPKHKKWSRLSRHSFTPVTSKGMLFLGSSLPGPC